jgi:2-polyprenyl-6-methoxyphenol hydroxylase-like FAD-dependent oxidoreductase
MVARIVVLGGGVCGLAAGMLLARDGHDVVVLERDAAPVPGSVDEAWERWKRTGVAQFRQPHYLHPRARHVLDAELPDVRDALAAAGAYRFDTLTTAPASLGQLERRAGDEQFVTLTARRPALELVVARAAEAEPRLEVRRGVAVAGLKARDLSGVPNVIGVRTESGEELEADLVVDAMGRRSPLPKWLDDIGAAPLHEETEDSGFVYYTRYFRSTGGGRPQPRDRLLSAIGSISVLTLPGDDDTWSVTLFGSSRDRPLTQLREVGRWSAVVAACPLQAHWLDGRPITEVLPMAGILDRYRRLASDGRPVVTGLAAVADAWACTNPSLGRGIALGLVHAAHLRDAARALPGDPSVFAAAWDAVTEAELTPWYRATVAVDRAHLAEIEALSTGREPPRSADPAVTMRLALVRSMHHDADVFRAFMEIAGCLALPGAIFARPGFAERVLEVAARHEDAPPPGPTRDELLRLLA